MKSMKFIFGLLVVIGLQQKVYGGLNYRKFSPSALGVLLSAAPSAFVPTKIKYSSMIQVAQNNEDDMILLKDYLAIKAVDLFKSAQESFKGVRQSATPFIHGATAVLSTVTALILF